MADSPERVIIDGVPYVREKPAPSTGRFRVTVQRMDGRQSTGHATAGGAWHTIDVIAGSWIAALKDASNHTGWFDYHH